MYFQSATNASPILDRCWIGLQLDLNWSWIGLAAKARRAHPDLPHTSLADDVRRVKQNGTTLELITISGKVSLISIK